MILVLFRVSFLQVVASSADYKDVDAIVQGFDLGAVPERLSTRKRVYSWAYHKMEAYANSKGLTGDIKRCACAKKARLISESVHLQAS